jgi:hypothetical protein
MIRSRTSLVALAGLLVGCAHDLELPPSPAIAHRPENELFRLTPDTITYCVDGDSAKCASSKLPASDGLVEGFASVHRLTHPEITDVIWLAFESTDFDLLRCAASPGHPAPVCQLSSTNKENDR